MDLPLQITFQNMPHSDAIAAKVRERAGKLEKYFDSIIGCRVVVEAPHHHHAAGNHFLVRVEVSVPGDKLVARREPDEHHAYTDVYVAIRDAFDTMRRLLEDYARRRRGQVKAHEGHPHGRVVELNPGDGYGTIEAPDGRLVYFHRNSVHGAEFDQLQIGTEVRFNVEDGERGPQASVVRVTGKIRVPG